MDEKENFQLDFGRNILIGTVFDISMSHDKTGRIIDSAKNLLIKCVLDKNVLTRIYTSHPNWDKIPKDQGESTYYLITYQEVLNFSVDVLLKKAINLIDQSVEEVDKHIVLFTDRFVAPLNSKYKKAFLFNEIRGYNMKIHVIGIGNNYDKISLKSLCEEYKISFYHVNEVGVASEIMSNIIGE